MSKSPPTKKVASPEPPTHHNDLHRPSPPSLSSSDSTSTVKAPSPLNPNYSPMSTPIQQSVPLGHAGSGSGPGPGLSSPPSGNGTSASALPPSFTRSPGSSFTISRNRASSTSSGSTVVPTATLLSRSTSHPQDQVTATTLSFAALRNRDPSPGRLVLRPSNTGMETPPNAPPSRWWDMKEVQKEKRGWADSSSPARKKTIPEEQQQAFQHTGQRVSAAARSVLGHTVDIVHEGLGIFAEAAELIPLPGLGLAAKTLLNIWDAMQDVDMNRMACLRLVERCADILYGIREEIHDAGDDVAEELHEPIHKLEEAFIQVCRFLQKQGHRPFLKRYLKRDEILRDISGCDASLTEALSVFSLSIQIRILKQVQANEARRQADTAALIRVLLGQHQDSTIKDAHLLDALDILEPPGEQQSATPIAARSTETLHLDIPDRPQSQVGPQPHVEGLPHVHAQTQVFTLPDDVSTPTQSFPINWATTLSHIHSPTQCRALISVLQSRQNASDRTHDALDLKNVLKTALRKGNDVEILGLLQIGRDEIPEAIKTLQRAYEREIERDEIEKEGSDGTPAGSALGLSAENSPALASASTSIGAGASTMTATNKDGWTNTVRTFESMDSIESAVSTPATVDSYTSYTSTSSSTRRPRDTLDREFIEGGIEALKRLSKTRVDVPSWTITRYEVDREAKIGMGSFSNVYRGTWRGRTVAIKVLIESTPQHLFQREISIWQRLKNRNVLPLFGASSATGDPPWFFVSPYYRNGTLAEYLKRLPSKSMVLGGGVDVLKMLCEIARGMEYLHKEGVMHGDLKASNVLVSDTLRCVICDFGQSEMKSEAYRLSGTPIPHGTLRWQAPEVMMGQDKLTWQVDSYAFGICCIEILQKGGVPWPLNDEYSVRRFVLHDNARPQLPASPFRTPELDRMISACLSRDPDARPTFASLVSLLRTMRGKTGHGDVDETMLPPSEQMPVEPPHKPSPTPGFKPLPGDDPHPSPTDPRPPGDYHGQSPNTVPPSVVHLPQQTTPEGSIYVSSSGTSSVAEMEVDRDLMSSGLLSPNPDNPIVAATLNERRYRLNLVHDFHDSLILPLWSPGYVQLGDVGYLDKPAGEFKTLFNAFDPEHSSNGLMTNTGRLQGFGDLMTETVRMDKRSPAQRGYDAIQQLNPFKKTGPPTVGRHYSYQLRTGRRAAILVTEVTSHHYMTKLEVPKKWFMASIDTIMRVYGERLKLAKEDIRLIIGKLDAADHGQFISHSHPDSQLTFNVFSAPRTLSPWGEFNPNATPPASAIGPHYLERPLGPSVYTAKVSDAKRTGPWDSVLLARLRFKPDVAEPTSM